MKDHNSIHIVSRQMHLDLQAKLEGVRSGEFRRDDVAKLNEVELGQLLNTWDGFHHIRSVSHVNLGIKEGH